jgi:hypothetical protein
MFAITVEGSWLKRLFARDRPATYGDGRSPHTVGT